MIQNDSKKMQKNAPEFLCKLCDFVTRNKYNYTKHLATDKHTKIHNDFSKMHFKCRYL